MVESLYFCPNSHTYEFYFHYSPIEMSADCTLHYITPYSRCTVSIALSLYVLATIVTEILNCIGTYHYAIDSVDLNVSPPLSLEDISMAT